MFVIAVTGGVASGKSLFANVFSELAGDDAERFDCDQSVHSLLAEPKILTEIKSRYGSEVFDDDGSLNRHLLRERVFASEDDRKDLETLLHPKVLGQAEQAVKAASDQDEPPAYLLIEVPLLYEVDFSLQRDTDVVVAASPEVQMKRLRENRDLGDEVIEQILKAQLPMEDKISRAERVIWNDGCEAELQEEVHLLKAWIDKKIGE
jgi:dephospho-CoA kinase